jgi:hypothetical protein
MLLASDSAALREGFMAITDWRLKGQWIKNCNCAFGCPCDFNARPTHEVCQGLVAMHILQGHFGKVKLDGLSFIATVDFPGPLHEGNGKLQVIIDERASQEQRDALFGILSGQNSEPGTIFNIFSLIVTKMHEPIFAPIEFSFDLAKRRAHLAAKGALVSDVEPIRNPVTGAEHRIQVMMPEGFEHRGAEVAAARIESTGAIKFVVQQGHGSLALVEQTPRGVAA